jgi:hypothetical protein
MQYPPSIRTPPYSRTYVRYDEDLNPASPGRRPRSGDRLRHPRRVRLRAGRATRARLRGSQSHQLRAQHWLLALRDRPFCPARMKKARDACRGPKERTGGDLLSQEVALQVPSALRGLTALFGMGRGVSLSLCTTGKFARPPRWSLKTAQDQGKNIRQALEPLVPVG